jgi:hypothetical protein
VELKLKPTKVARRAGILTGAAAQEAGDAADDQRDRDGIIARQHYSRFDCQHTDKRVTICSSGRDIAMTSSPVQRDERTVFVENASYRRAYSFLSYGLLVIVMYRAWFYREASWDLMGLTVVGGIVALSYQSREDLPEARKDFLVSAVTSVVGFSMIAFAYWWGLLK